VKKEPGLEEAAFATARAWGQWLGKNHAVSTGVWVRIARKDSGIRSVSYEEAVEAALCHGWIDGQKRGGDAGAWLQKFTPRGPRSIWSQVNREKAERLIQEGRMAPAGLEAVKKARADGRWEAAYHSQSAASVPADLQAALDRDPSAREFFGTLKSANRYAILWRLETAKKPETRARRLETLVQMLREKRTIHPQ